MKRSIYAITFGCALVTAATQATALQITNRDTSDHALVITEAGATQDIVLKPQETLEGFCLQGCTVRTSDGEEYEFDGTEVVSIEEGLMFLDGGAETDASDLPTDLPADAGPDSEGTAMQ